MKPLLAVCKVCARVIANSWVEYWSVEPYSLLPGSRTLAIKKLLDK